MDLVKEGARVEIIKRRGKVKIKIFNKKALIYSSRYIGRDILASLGSEGDKLLHLTVILLI